MVIFQDEDNLLFDVTDITHETMRSAAKDRKNKSKKGVSEAGDTETQVSHSCLDLIVSSPNLQLANRMLDIVPIQQIVDGYWSTYQWVYGVLMVIHVVYMSLLSAFAIPLIRDVSNSTQPSGTEENSPDAFPYVLFLLWPATLILFEMYYACANTFRSFRKENIHSYEQGRQSKNICSRAFRSLFRFVVRYLAHITAIVFSILIIVWFILYLDSDTSQAHVLSVGMVLGWLYTIVFTQGFRNFHSFTIMLKNIIIRDITRFLFMYLLVLFAFSFAFQCIFALVKVVNDEYSNPASIFFLTFNMMIGMGDIFYEGFDDDYENDDKKYSGTFLKVLYLVYIILTTVILLNLLIAMMTDSYQAVKRKEGTTWRVGSVQLAIEIEKSMPFLPKFFKGVGIKSSPLHYDRVRESWIMTLPKLEVTSVKKQLQQDVASEAIRRLESELHEMKAGYNYLNDRLDTLMGSSKQHEMAFSKAFGTGIRYRRNSLKGENNPDNFRIKY